MNCRKRYEAQGMMEWHPLLSAGKTRIRIPFTGGHLSGYGTTPASFETADAVVQAIIERSAYFKSGRIRLAYTRELPSTPIPTTPPTSPTIPSTSSVSSASITPIQPITPATPMHFGSLGEASDWLQSQKGILSSKMLSAEECIKMAASLGIDIEIAAAPEPKKGGSR